MMKPLISVLMANYNNAHFLGSAIESVLKQDFREWELVIVDDGSTDNSVSVIAQWVAQDSRIKFFRNNANRGVAYTKKVATDFAKAPVILILDPDDALEADALTRIYEAHAATPEVSLIWSDHYLCNARLEKLKASSSTFRGDSVAGYLGEEPGAIHHLWSFKKEFYLRTSGFDEKYRLAEDQDVFYKLEEVGATRYIPEPLYCYRFHDRGISTGPKTAEAFGWHLIAMLDALKRRRYSKNEKSTWKQCVEKHWLHFCTWGITRISTELLNKLLKAAAGSRLSARIIWLYAREKIRRNVRRVA